MCLYLLGPTLAQGHRDSASSEQRCNVIVCYLFHSSCDVITDATDGVVVEQRVFEDISPASNDGHGLRIRLFTPPASNAPLQASTSASVTLEHPAIIPDGSASCSSFVELADLLSPPCGSDLPCYTTFGEGGGAGDVGEWSRGRPDGNPLAFTNGIGCMGEDAARLKVCMCVHCVRKWGELNGTC